MPTSLLISSNISTNYKTDSELESSQKKTEAVTFKSTQPPATTTSKPAQTTKKRVCVPCQRRKVPPCRSSPTSKLNQIINHV